MSMIVGIAKIEYMDGPSPAVDDFLTYILDEKPEETWIISDSGNSFIQIEMETLKNLAAQWKKAKNEDEEEEQEVRDWLQELENTPGYANPVMLHINV